MGLVSMPVVPIQKQKKKDLSITMIEIGFEKFGFGECLICFEHKYINNVLYPCKHNGLCIDCANKLYDQKKPCPFCRAQIQQ